MPLVFTTDPPTEAGWFWVKEGGEDDAIVEVVLDISGFYVWMPTPPEVDDLFPLHGKRIAIEAFTHFAGPIERAADPLPKFVKRPEVAD